MSKNVKLIIKSTRGLASLKLRELWEYRELLYFFVWRDMKVRYKQTAIGAAWAIIQPLLSMLVFTLFFGKLAKIPSEGFPYSIFAYCGLLPWQFFSHALTNASLSLVTNERLITKIYFPRILLPTGSVLAGLIDFALAFLVLIGLMFMYGIIPRAALIVLPLFIILAVVTALGVSFWLAAFDVEYRDVRYILPFLTQFWLFATPVVYPSSLLPEPWRSMYGLNPMAGVVEGFRWALLGSQMTGYLIFVSVAVAILLLFSGAYYFRRVEKTFADII